MFKVSKVKATCKGGGKETVGVEFGVIIIIGDIYIYYIRVNYAFN